MKTGILGRRYAKALHAVATEQKVADQVGRDLEALGNAFATSEELREIFENPGFTQDMRRKVIQAIAARLGTSPLVTNISLMLSDRGRVRYFGDLVEAYKMLAESAAGRVRAEVVTATPMPDAYFEELERVLEQVTGKKVVLVKRHDPSLIAGVVARVGDRVFDGSVQNRLNELKDELLSR